MVQRIVSCDFDYGNVYALHRSADGAPVVDGNLALPPTEVKRMRLSPSTANLTSVEKTAYDTHSVNIESPILGDRFTGASRGIIEDQLGASGSRFIVKVTGKVLELGIAPRSGISSVARGQYQSIEPISPQHSQVSQSESVDLTSAERFSYFTAAVERLGRMKHADGFLISVLKIGHRKFPSNANKWHLIGRGESATNRRAFVAKLRVGGRLDCYIYEIEQDSDHGQAYAIQAFYAASKPFTDGSDGFDEWLVEDELAACAEKFGVWDPNETASIIRRRWNHPKYDLWDYERYLADMLQKRVRAIFASVVF